MRVLKAILLLWMGWASSAGACSCRERPSQYFLNTLTRHPASPYVDIPENAKGVLFFSDVDMRAVDSDAGRLLAEGVPAAVTASQFSIVEVETGRSLQPIVTRLNLDRHIGKGDNRSYKLRDFVYFKILHDVTAAVEKANGLFRVGPVEGFRSGRRYRFAYQPHFFARQSVWTEVRIGPAITLPSAAGYGLKLDGLLTLKMISMPDQGTCGEETAAMVQELNYTIPPSLEPYRNGVLFFTQQRARFGRDGKEPAFTYRRYEPDFCTGEPPGRSELGALKDLAVVRCNEYGLKEWGDRLVKGYLGMLEIEDNLHETAMFTIPFKKSAEAFCR